ATANRTFAVSSFSTWMCCMSWYVKKGNERLDKKAIRWPVSLHPFFSGKRNSVADKAKTLPIMTKQQ
ncbi:hypothetical protein DS885_08540, partial [Psychromonas sp. B3M02]|uniref:hypothetical protein n=1 Tax=Psychromonas sp. B3M02 TaxID=2267226 RepID=UPI000DFD9D76